MLGLHAERLAPGVGLGFALERAVEEIAGGELKTGFGGPHFHHAAGFGIGNFRRKLESRAGAIQDPVVVVSASESQLLILVFNPRTDRFRGSKIEWSSRDALQLA